VKASRTHIRLGPHDEGRRLDRVLRKLLPEVPLGRIYALLRTGAIRVSGRSRKPSHRVRAGETVELPAELAGEARRARGGNGKPPAPATGASESGSPNARERPALPAELSGRIVWENEHLLAVDKPAGIAVHGQEGLLALLRPYLETGASKSTAFRPGPVHRLDRNTSGLMLFPKSLPGAQRASHLLRERLLAKGYLAVLDGHLEGEQRWDDILERDRARGVTRRVASGNRTRSRRAPQRRHARTAVRALAWSREATLALARIETGRTHQIRAQAAAHGHPLAGDRKYGGTPSRAPGPAYILHAAVLLNGAPDAILPAEALCAPPRHELERALSRRFVGADAERAVDCEYLAEAVSRLVYKGPRNE
jgi:23S rRNA pseudouridine955/2504/2580 synthase